MPSSARNTQLSARSTQLLVRNKLSPVQPQSPEHSTPSSWPDNNWSRSLASASR